MTATDAQLLDTITAEAARVHATDPGEDCYADEWQEYALRRAAFASFVLGLLDADGRL